MENTTSVYTLNIVTDRPEQTVLSPTSDATECSMYVDLHCLPLIQQVYTQTGSTMCFFKAYNR